MTGQQLEDQLTQIEPFNILTYPALRRLVEHGRLVHGQEGQIIIGPNYGTTGFFVILEGTVVVSLPFGPVLAYLEEGQTFGEIAPLDGVERTAYCRAYTDCLLFEIPMASFHADLLTNPLIREVLDQQSITRLNEQRSIDEGGAPPDLAPPEKPEKPLAEAPGDEADELSAEPPVLA